MASTIAWNANSNVPIPVHALATVIVLGMFASLSAVPEIFKAFAIIACASMFTKAIYWFNMMSIYALTFRNEVPHQTFIYYLFNWLNSLWFITDGLGPHVNCLGSWFHDATSHVQPVLIVASPLSRLISRSQQLTLTYLQITSCSEFREHVLICYCANNFRQPSLGIMFIDPFVSALLT